MFHIYHKRIVYHTLIKPLETSNVYDRTQSFSQNLHSDVNNEEIFLQDFLIILKRMFQNYKKILKKYVFVTT